MIRSPDRHVIVDVRRPDADSSQEREPEDSEGTVPVSADAPVGEFDFSAEKVLLNSGWEMPIIGTGTWALSDEEAVESGKLHSIGISNYYTKEQVDEVLSFAEITPAVIQNENHIYYQNAELRDYVKQYGIVMESWYPFGGRGHTQENFENDVILDIAEAHGKTAAQIILRWHLQDGYIAIPGSGNPDHIAENYDIFDFELSEDEMDRIRGIDEQRRYEHW